MKKERFKAELLPGHKVGAVEVPFDPAKQWAIPPKQLWRGRHGHSVQADLNGACFETFIVPRSRKFFMLVNDELQQAAGISVGDVVSITVEPVVGPASRPQSATRPSASKRGKRNTRQ